MVKVVRVLIALQAVGGAVGIVIGVFTLNGPLVAAGLAQLVFAGVLLSISLGSEQIVEAKGSAGAFVIRTGPHRQWKDKRGLSRLTAFVMGHRTWRASVRARADDPFGKPVAAAEGASEREAMTLAQEFGERIRAGEDPSEGQQQAKPDSA